MCAAWGRGLKEDRQPLWSSRSPLLTLSRCLCLWVWCLYAHASQSIEEYFRRCTLYQELCRGEEGRSSALAHTRDAAAQPCCAGGLWRCALVGPRHAVWPVDHPGSSVHMCACVHPNVCPLLVGPDCAGRVERRRTTRDRRQLPLSAPRKQRAARQKAASRSRGAPQKKSNPTPNHPIHLIAQRFFETDWTMPYTCTAQL